jgi:hypothetical protein
MIALYHARSTITIQPTTRDLMKKLASNDQTYDSFLLELHQLKQKRDGHN